MIRKQWLVLVLAGCLVPALIQARDYGKTATTSDRATYSSSMDSMSSTSVINASKLIGKSVENPQGEKLGTVKDLVLDSNRQNISYVALSSGGVVWIRGKTLCDPLVSGAGQC